MIRTMKKRVMAGLSAIAILMISTTASAEWGDGVGEGAFRLHPGLSLSMGYDSNIFHSSGSGFGQLSQAPSGTIEPFLSVQTVNASSWDLSGRAGVSWQQYLSPQANVRNQSGLAASVDGSALWNSDGPVSLQLSERFVRTNETPNYVSGTPINRIFNKAGVRAGLHPGGRVLETFASYDFSLYRHNRFRDLDRHTHHLGWDGSWSFLPKTSIVANVDYRMIRYQEPMLGTDRISNPEGRLVNSDSNPLRVMGGLAGQFTPRISFNLRGGYGWGFYEVGPTTQQALAETTLSYQFGNIEFDNRFRLGYRFGFNDSSIGNFYRYHRAVAGYQQGFVGDRLRLGVDVDAQMRSYASLGIDEIQTENNRISIPDQLSDLLLGVNGTINYGIRKGWDVGLRYSFRSNFSEDQIVIDGIAEDAALRDYQRHNVVLSTTLRY